MNQSAVIKKDLELLNACYGILQSLASKRNVAQSAQYYEAFTLVSTMKIVKREAEKRAYALAVLQHRDPPRPTADPELPIAPEEVRRNPSTIHQSDFFQTAFGARGT